MSSSSCLLIGIIVVIELCAANAAGLKEPSDRIVGGFLMTIEQNPWQVSLQRYSQHHCGGSIIGTRWVLTAAHCTNGIPTIALAVRAGSSLHAIGGKIIPLRRYVQHPKYKILNPFDYDISLLELTERLTFNYQIQPIALPEVNTEIPDGTLCRVSGWGNTIRRGNGTTAWLLAVNVPIVNQHYCNVQYHQSMYHLSITPAMICAGFENGGKNSCSGDSGGPLTNVNGGTRQLIGVVSFGGRKCTEPEFPGVYSRVTASRRWIKSVTGI